jgi:RNA polymerase sigma factor (sigma-70 family)
MQNDVIRCQTKPLTVEIIGRRGKQITVTIPEFPDDLDLRRSMQEPFGEDDWRFVLIQSYYEEALNDRRETRCENVTSLDAFTYEDARFFSSPDNPALELEKKEFMESALSCLNDNQREIIQRCVIEGMAYSDLAREKGKDESAIRKAAKRAIATIKRNML